MYFMPGDSSRAMKKADIKFMKTYAKKSYETEQNQVATDFDIQNHQVSLFTIDKVNKEQNKDHKYDWKAHIKRIKSILSSQQTIEMEDVVNELNSMADPLWRDKYKPTDN